jgi:FlaA1/EpsC-like NDP-sugar epimerase
VENLAKTAYRYGIRNYLPIKFTVDLSLWVLAAPFAFILRLEMQYTKYVPEILIYTVVGVLIKAALILVLGLYRQSWHKVGVRDLYVLLQATGIGTLALFSLAFLCNDILSIPRSIPLLEGGLTLLALSGIRLSFRWLHEREMTGLREKPARRVLIVGAGNAGTMLVREMFRHPESGLEPLGYLDDESSKLRKTFVGIPVLGTIDDLPRVVVRIDAEEVLIAMPSAPGTVIRQVINLARQAQVRYRIIPGFYEILSGDISLAHLREIAVDDLLRREPVELDLAGIATYLEGQTVLVTGAGGSIGSEIVRQTMHFEPKQLILLDRDENNLYLLQRELEVVYRTSATDLHTVVLDIQRLEKLEQLFQHYQPQVIFHAAAYKHVPMMETNPDEAILNNICGTKHMLLMANRYDISYFVNISTDKAIKPTSIMGASKRVAEYLVTQIAQQAKEGQHYVSVRFGNVLDSRGSVVPIFKEQIRRGGPVTVTHPEMTRYFMSIPEATQLVLQTVHLGQNGGVYLLNMGDPVKIVDLAHDLIHLSGLEPEVDIAIEYTGIRPGEKLFEELMTESEHLSLTEHEKVFLVPKAADLPEDFESLLDDLLAAACQCDEAQIRSTLKALIPDYKPNQESALESA